MVPALEPPPVPTVNATRARPVTGLIPTATGVRESGLPLESAEGKLSRAVTVRPVRSTTASVLFPLFATRARLRKLSTATLTGPGGSERPAPGHGVSVDVRVAPSDSVQMKPTRAGVGCVR